MSDKKKTVSNYLEQVGEFHKTFNHPSLKQPTLINEERAALRFRLIEEELGELIDAYNEKDIVGVADALSDLQYVLSGAIHEFGLTEKFDELFNEVHRSNMSKLASSKEEANASIEHYKELDGTIARYKEENGVYFILRTSDGKTLKAKNYSPAALADILKI